jgi:hypothetical protein
MVLLSIDCDAKAKLSPALVEVLGQATEDDIISLVLYFHQRTDESASPCPDLKDFASRDLHRRAVMEWANERNGYLFAFVRKMETRYPGRFRYGTTSSIILGCLYVDAFPDVIAALAQDPFVAGVTYADSAATLIDE